MPAVVFAMPIFKALVAVSFVPFGLTARTDAEVFSHEATEQSSGQAVQGRAEAVSSSGYRTNKHWCITQDAELECDDTSIIKVLGAMYHRSSIGGCEQPFPSTNGLKKCPAKAVAAVQEHCDFRRVCLIGKSFHAETCVENPFHGIRVRWECIPGEPSKKSVENYAMQKQNLVLSASKEQLMENGPLDEDGITDTSDQGDVATTAQEADDEWAGTDIVDDDEEGVRLHAASNRKPGEMGHRFRPTNNHDDDSVFDEGGGRHALPGANVDKHSTDGHHAPEALPKKTMRSIPVKNVKPKQVEPVKGKRVVKNMAHTALARPDTSFSFTPCYRWSRTSMLQHKFLRFYQTNCNYGEGCFKVKFPAVGQDFVYSDPRSPPSAMALCGAELREEEDSWWVTFFGIGLQRNDFNTWGVCMPRGEGLATSYFMQKEMYQQFIKNRFASTKNLHCDTEDHTGEDM